MSRPRESRREEIAAWLALREREGLTYAELSERCGLAATTLSWWSWRLRRDAPKPFAEVDVRPEPVPAGDDRSYPIMVRRGPWTVEVSAETEPDSLRAILSVIADLPC